MFAHVPQDGRTDLGYGRTKAKFHKSRSAGSLYPYIELPDLDEYDDDDTEAAIKSKTPLIFKTDPFASKGTDKFYFVGGNTKLSDCFERPDDVLKEIHAMGDSMSPVPSLYKGKTSTSTGRAAGASFPAGVGSYRRTGTKKGYSSAPPKYKIDIEDIPNEEEEDEPIMSLNDLSSKQAKRKGIFSPRRGIFNP